MTIAALRALLDQELPDVPRHPAPRLLRRRPLPSKDPAMDTPTVRPPAPAVPGIELPDKTLAELLLWAGQHADPDIVAVGEQARTAVTTLTDRRKRDAELAQITDETAELERRLAELRARQAELQPAKRTPRKAPDYPPAEVRAWAREHGHQVPERGRVPATVVAAWRSRNGIEG